MECDTFLVGSGHMNRSKEYLFTETLFTFTDVLRASTSCY